MGSLYVRQVSHPSGPSLQVLAVQCLRKTLSQCAQEKDGQRLEGLRNPSLHDTKASGVLVKGGKK